MVHPIRRWLSALWSSSRSSLFIIICLLTPQISPVTGYARAPLANSSNEVPSQDDSRSNAAQTSSTGGIAPAGTGANIPALELGKKIERDVAGEEAHSYRLNLEAGQYAQVGVDQRRINLMISAFDAQDNKVAESDLYLKGDVERMSFVAEAAASYRLEIKSPPVKTPVKGQYEISITQLRPATPEDKNIVAVERLLAEAFQLRVQQNMDLWRKATEKYQEAVLLSQAGKSPAWEATALYSLSVTYTTLGEREKAMEAATRAVKAADVAAALPGKEDRELGIKVKAIALDTLGSVHLEFGDKKKALELFTEALKLKESINERANLATTVNNIGMAYGYMGEVRKSLEWFEKSQVLVREAGEINAEATILNNLCVISSNLGDYKKALDLCNESASIRKVVGNDRDKAVVLDNTGTVYSSMGEYQTAIDFHTRAYTIYKASGNDHGQGISLNNIGWIYATLGDFEKSNDYYNQSLEKFRKLKDRYREAIVLSNIGANNVRLGDYKKALDVQLQLVPIREQVGDDEGRATTLNNIANCYQNLSQKENAAKYYEESLAIYRRLGGKARLLISTLSNVGSFYRDLGEYQKASGYFNEGLQMSRKVGDRLGEAGILGHMARLERDRDNLDAARGRIEEALAAIESLRLSVKSHHLRASFLASMKKYYELDIEVLMRLHAKRPAEGFAAAALHASEKGRARSLLELLTEAGAEIRRDVEPALLERESVLRQLILDQAAEQQSRGFGSRTQDEQAAVAREIDNLTTEYEQLQARIRQSSPRYGALTQPVPLTLKEIQTQVLDDETLLLEYALGEKQSYLWAVSPNSIRSFELPGRQTVESAARRVYENITARKQHVSSESPEQRRTRLQQADAEFPAASEELSRMLLGPVAAELKNKRLLIVADGMLQYLPFAALPDPSASQPVAANSTPVKTAAGAPASFYDRPPLIVAHEVISLPSASVLAVLRREAQGRKPAEKTVAVFADPVFNNTDPRVGAKGKEGSPAAKETAVSRDISRAAAESGLEDLARLRFSRLEAEQIMRMVPEGKSFGAVDFAANRSAATSGDLRNYAILHFATHGLINNQHPELSGIVLSLVDERGQPQDGFLRLFNIYNLKLDAELVVLSACQTALGKEVKGEGLVSLTRGFMYAGAPRVVATLWPIYDRATADFMGRFYEAMLRQKVRPAAALRQAQVSMWKDKRWQAPYYWAGFALQGEWK